MRHLVSNILAAPYYQHCYTALFPQCLIYDSITEPLCVCVCEYYIWDKMQGTLNNQFQHKMPCAKFRLVPTNWDILSKKDLVIYH